MESIAHLWCTFPAALSATKLKSLGSMLSHESQDVLQGASVDSL